MMYYLFALVTLVGLLSTVCKDVLSVVLTNWQEPLGVGLIIGRPPYHLQHNKYRNNDNRIILHHTVFLKCVQLYFSTVTENISVAEGVCLTIDRQPYNPIPSDPLINSYKKPMYTYTGERRDVLGCTSMTTKRFLEVGGDVQHNASRLEEVYGHSLIINPYIRIYQEIYPSQYFPAIDERMIYICKRKKLMSVITTQNFITNYYETNIKVADKLNDTFSRQLMSHQLNKASPMVAPKKRKFCRAPHTNLGANKWCQSTLRKPQRPCQRVNGRVLPQENEDHEMIIVLHGANLLLHWRPNWGGQRQGKILRTPEQTLKNQMNKYWIVKWTNTIESNEQILQNQM